VLALAFSVLITVYLVVPEAAFRYIFGSFVPTRSFVLTRVETVYRAVLVSVIPLLVALFLVWFVPGPSNWPFPVRGSTDQSRRTDYKIVAAALYSDAEFARTQRDFWPAFTRSSRRQARLVSWYYLTLALTAWGAGKLATKYGKYKSNSLYKAFADRFLFEYISQWYPLLTPYVLPSTSVRADILCTNDTLYQGTVADHFLSGGELSGIILQEPRRFDRKSYLEQKGRGAKPDKEKYWVPIPSELMYFFADKILNLNLTYLDQSGKAVDTRSVEKYLETQLGNRTGKITVSVKGPIEPAAGESKNLGNEDNPTS
jgi:hypothetical protein